MSKGALRDTTRAVVHRIHAPLQETGFALRPAQGHLVLLSGGAGRLIAPVGRDARPVSLPVPGLAWLPAGAEARFVAAPGTVGWLIALPGPVLSRGVPAGLDEALRGLLADRLLLPVEEAPLRARLNAHLEALRDELATAGPGGDAACDCLLGLVLLSLWRIALARRATGGGEGRGLSDRFVLLVQQQVRAHWPVAKYCAALGTDRDQLGRAVRRATGQSPRAYLHGELHRQARDLLLGTGLQVAQIGYRLGFSDPAYFNRFFTRMEGVPPSRFRRGATRSKAVGSGSFAAWP